MPVIMSFRLLSRLRSSISTNPALGRFIRTNHLHFIDLLITLWVSFQRIVNGASRSLSALLRSLGIQAASEKFYLVKSLNFLFLSHLDFLPCLAFRICILLKPSSPRSCVSMHDAAFSAFTQRRQDRFILCSYATMVLGMNCYSSRYTRLLVTEISYMQPWSCSASV